jgi:hypothetical protein
MVKANGWILRTGTRFVACCICNTSHHHISNPINLLCNVADMIQRVVGGIISLRGTICLSSNSTKHGTPYLCLWNFTEEVRNYFLNSYRHINIWRSRGSVVCIATGYGLDGGGVGVRVSVGVHPTSYSMGTGGISPGVKRQGREADHSPPTSGEVKRMWIYASISPFAFMA